MGAERCIGCRYCQIACPYEIPKFEWEAFNAKVVKCEFCGPRLAKNQEPACTFVCPTHAVIFGRRDVLMNEAHKRVQASPGKYFQNKVYGEKEAGGTQVLYLSHVDFAKLGLPTLPADEHPGRWMRWSGVGAEMVPAADRDLRRHRREAQRELPRASSGNERRTQEDGIDTPDMSTATQTQSDLTVVRWQRGVPVFGVPVRTRNFYFLLGLSLLGFVLVIYRQVAGLGAVTRFERRLSVGHLEDLQRDDPDRAGLGQLSHRHRGMDVSQAPAARGDAHHAADQLPGLSHRTCWRLRWTWAVPGTCGTSSTSSAGTPSRRCGKCCGACRCIACCRCSWKTRLRFWSRRITSSHRSAAWWCGSFRSFA